MSLKRGNFDVYSIIYISCLKQEHKFEKRIMIFQFLPIMNNE